MKCQCHQLADSSNGRITLYGYAAPDDTGTPGAPDRDRHNIALQFNNITQWLCYEDFLALEWNVRAIDTTAYFDAHPYEERIHLSTPSRFLSFSRVGGPIHAARVSRIEKNAKPGRSAASLVRDAAQRTELTHNEP